MLNLPLLPISQPVPGNTSSAISLATPVTPVSGQQRDQTFSDMLRNTEQEMVAEEQNGIAIAPPAADESPAQSLVELPIVMSTDTAAAIPPENMIAGPGMPLISGMSPTTQPATDSLTSQLKTKASLTGQSDFLTDDLSSTNTLPPEQVTSSFHPIVSKPGQSVFAAASLVNDADAALPPGQVTRPSHSMASRPGQSVFAAASLLNDADAALPPEQVTSPSHSMASRPGQPVFAAASLLNADADMPAPVFNPMEPLSSINMVADNAAILTDSGKSLPLSTASANSSPAATISVPMSATLGDSAWPDEFSQKITWLATERLQTAELKLHPAHLGPIEVLLKMTNEQGIQQLTAQFTSQNPLVRETIEANLPRLREAMAESGIALTDTSVGADTPRQDARNPQRPPAHPHPPGNKNTGSSDIRQDSAQMAISQMSIINTFA